MTHDFARLTNIVSEASKVREDIARALTMGFEVGQKVGVRPQHILP